MASFDWQFFDYFEKLKENLNMHSIDDPISDMHAKNYLIILCLTPLPGPQNLVPSFGPVFSGAVRRIQLPP